MKTFDELYDEQHETITKQAEQITELKIELEETHNECADICKGWIAEIARLEGLLNEAISKGVMIRDGEVSIPKIARLKEELRLLGAE